MKVPHVRKIAVLRANGLGDLIFALPALEALRHAYPEAELVWLGRPLHYEFFSSRPGPVDRVVIVPPSRGVRDEPEGEDEEVLADFFQTMTSEQFDVAVQIHDGGRFSNRFLKRLGARLTVGLRSAEAIALDRSVPYIYFQHEVLRYLEVTALLGAEPIKLEPSVCVTQQDLAEVDALLPQVDQPQVVIDLAERLSLGGLIGCLSRSCLVMGNDSGPLHLARTVGAGTLGVYWCGNFINASPITRTRHRAAISWRLACPVCGIHCLEGQCPHTESFMDEVSVAEVTAQALDLIRHDTMWEHLPSMSLGAP